MLQQKTGTNRNLMKKVCELFKLEHELHSKYDFGRNLLIDIDTDFNQEIRNGLTSLSKIIEECIDNLQLDIVKVNLLYEKNIHELTLLGEKLEIEQTLRSKRLTLNQVTSKISTIISNLGQVKTPHSTTNRRKNQIMREFPTRTAQITELTRVQENLQSYEEFLSPNQINLKIIAVKSDIHNYEKFVSLMSHWPSGFLESVFVMQNKASSHAISSIFAHVRTFSSLILPRNTFLHLWLVTDGGNIEEIKDFTNVHEIRYALLNDTETNKIHVPKELIMLLIIQGICGTFQAPFIVLDDIFEVFDRKYWNMISYLFKVLSEKQQIIVIKGITEETWMDNGKPDKIVTIRADTREITLQEEPNIDLDERDLYISLKRALQNLSLV